MANKERMQEAVDSAVQDVTDNIVVRGPDKFTPDDIYEFYVLVSQRLVGLAVKARD